MSHVSHVQRPSWLLSAVTLTHLHINFALKMPSQILTRVIITITCSLLFLVDAIEDATAGVSMGTTIVAAKFDGGVVLASDSRTSVSTYVSNRYAAKINVLFDHGAMEGDAACVCRSGSAADTQHLIERVREDLFRRQHSSFALPQVSVKSAAFYMKHLMNRILEKENPNFSCALICAGYDSKLGEGVIYSILPSGAFFDESDVGVVTLGSGSVFVQAYLDNYYRPNMNRDEAISFLARAVELAMARDGQSGGSANLCVIDKNGCKLISDATKILSSTGPATKLNGFADAVKQQ